ncbi:autotransporter assembly complex protein TamA [Hyphomonas sp.]|uniref:autotransporter assembly complex protein TamA n=1 Tax=Hyphomonas sp. TaxID=87 RepID=UPI00391D346A
MKPGPLNPALIRLRPMASACALGALTACASFGGGPSDSGEVSTSNGAYRLSGMPPQLAPRASALLNRDDPAPRSVLELRNRAQTAARTVEEFLASEGYLAAEAVPEDITSLDRPPLLRVETGPMFRIASAEIAGIDAVDAETQRGLRQAAASLPAGSPVRASEIERIESELVAILLRNGYAFATSPGIDALASRTDADVEITYMLVPGPQVRLGELIASGPETEREQRTVRVLRTWRPGDLYSPRTIDRLRSRLRSTGLYEGIGVEIAAEPDANGLHDVTVTLAEAKARTFGAGVSASTTEGIGADAFWERRNITGRGDKVSVRATAATLRRELVTEYERPNIGRFGRTLTAEAGVREIETQAFDLLGLKVGAALAQPFSRQLLVSVGAAVDATRTTDQRTRLFLGERDQLTFAVPVSATYTDVDNALDPQSGIRGFAGVESGISLGSGTPGYTRMQVSASTYREIADGLVLAVRAEYGAFSGSSAVPADRLFFAGGGGTVRGYEYQSLSPRDPTGVLIGGRGLFSTSAELRWRRSERFGYAAFVDAGAASDDAGNVFAESKAAIGLGVRYYPGFGPIRFDIAAPLQRREGDAPVQIYVSIGQAF